MPVRLRICLHTNHRLNQRNHFPQKIRFATFLLNAGICVQNQRFYRIPLTATHTHTHEPRCAFFFGTLNFRSNGFRRKFNSILVKFPSLWIDKDKNKTSFNNFQGKLSKISNINGIQIFWDAKLSLDNWLPMFLRVVTPSYWKLKRSFWTA